MTDRTWQDVAAGFIVALPGIIAAVSSLRNGRRLKNGAQSDAHFWKLDTSRESRKDSKSGHK